MTDIGHDQVFRRDPYVPMDQGGINGLFQVLDPLILKGRNRDQRVLGKSLLNLFYRKLQGKILFINDHYLLLLFDLKNNLQIILIEVPASVKDQKNEVSIGYPFLRPSYSFLLNEILSLSQSSGIHQADRNAMDIQNFFDHISCRPGNRGNDGSLLLQ